jgi:tRNA pseudouridine13 synthase
MKPLGTGLERNHALGAPATVGRIRLRAEDFRVDECLGFEPAGSGGHLLIQVEKRGVNTVDAAGMLARHAGAAPRDTGYSGLKDRHAVCTQWFTLPFIEGVDWQALPPGIRILRCERHHRKLKRGSHHGNRFRIRAVLDRIDGVDLENRLRAVRSGGVPNYFGEQRIGRRFEDNARQLLEGRRLPRLQRGMTLSGIRSDLFNRVLQRRVAEGCWNAVLPGEFVNLEGTRSGFAARDDDADIARRIGVMDLHPTGPLYGSGANPATGRAASLEDEVLGRYEPWCELLASAGLKLERRPTRCVARDLDWRLDQAEGVLELDFVLRRGQFATSVLREILDYRDVTRAD